MRELTLGKSTAHSDFGMRYVAGYKSRTHCPKQIIVDSFWVHLNTASIPQQRTHVVNEQFDSRHPCPKAPENMVHMN